jgi:septal ring factor EnvC (AmiA/AmiB activator)
VIRGFAGAGRQAGVLARRIVEVYRAEAFGGVAAPPETARELRRLIRELSRIAAAAAIVFLAAGSAARAADPPREAPPSASAADTRYAELGRLQARVEDSRRRLAEAEKKTATLQQEVEALDLRLELAQRQRELIAARRDDLARRARALQGDLATSQNARRRSLDAFRGRILLLSRLGRFGYFRLLLSARRTSEVFVALKALDAMAQADARELARYTDAGVRLASDLTAQKVLQKETDQLLAQDRDEERRIAAGKSERLRLLSRSKSETIATRQQVTELSQKAEKLESLLDLLSRGESAAVGSPRPWRGVLDWPVRGTIAVTFGRHRHPRFNAWTISNGIEIAATDGTPVAAVYSGRVVFARWFSEYGNMAVIDHGDEVLTLYARLRSIFVHNGDVVATGDRVGLVGIGPGETEPSLYFEVRDHQKATDPMSWLR